MFLPVDSAYRSSHYSDSIKKAVRNIHRKMPLLESLFNKVAGLLACNFIKKRLQHRCFPVNVAKFLRTDILKNICERLFLCLMDFLEQIVFKEAFQNGLSNDVRIITSGQGQSQGEGWGQFSTGAIVLEPYLRYLFLTIILLLFHLIHLFH